MLLLEETSMKLIMWWALANCSPSSCSMTRSDWRSALVPGVKNMVKWGLLGRGSPPANNPSHDENSPSRIFITLGQANFDTSSIHRCIDSNDCRQVMS